MSTTTAAAAAPVVIENGGVGEHKTIMDIINNKGNNGSVVMDEKAAAKIDINNSGENGVNGTPETKTNGETTIAVEEIEMTNGTTPEKDASVKISNVGTKSGSSRFRQFFSRDRSSDKHKANEDAEKEAMVVKDETTEEGGEEGATTKPEAAAVEDEMKPEGDQASVPKRDNRFVTFFHRKPKQTKPQTTQEETTEEDGGRGDEETARVREDTLFGLNMLNRDERGLNDHVKLAFEDVFAEPDSYHSWDCTWRVTARVFLGVRSFVYKLLAMILAIPCALLWGVLLAIVTVFNVWACVPLARVCVIPATWIAKVWNWFIRSLFDPIFRSCGLVCGSMNVTRTTYQMVETNPPQPTRNQQQLPIIVQDIA